MNQYYSEIKRLLKNDEQFHKVTERNNSIRPFIGRKATAEHIIRYPHMIAIINLAVQLEHKTHTY